MRFLTQSLLTHRFQHGFHQRQVDLEQERPSNTSPQSTILPIPVLDLFRNLQNSSLEFNWQILIRLDLLSGGLNLSFVPSLKPKEEIISNIAFHSEYERSVKKSIKEYEEKLKKVDLSMKQIAKKETQDLTPFLQEPFDIKGESEVKDEVDKAKRQQLNQGKEKIKEKGIGELNTSRIKSKTITDGEIILNKDLYESEIVFLPSCLMQVD